MEEITLLFPNDFFTAEEELQELIVAGEAAPCNCQCSAPKGRLLD